MAKLTFHSGLPETRRLMGARRYHEKRATKEDSMVRYVVLIRSPDDPERASRAKNADPNEWRWKVNAGTTEEWARRIIQHLADGVPRTFNRIMVEIAGITADIAFQKAPEHGLWLAVERGYLGWTDKAPIFFKLIRPEGFRKRRGMDQPVPEIASLGSVQVELPKLKLEGNFTAFDVGTRGRQSWLSLGGFSSLKAAKEAARAWTLITGRSVYVFNRSEKIAYETMFTKEMMLLYTKGWETPRSVRTGGPGDPAKNERPILVRLLGDSGRTGRLMAIFGEDPTKGYFGTVLWDDAQKSKDVPLTSLAKAGKQAQQSAPGGDPLLAAIQAAQSRRGAPSSDPLLAALQAAVRRSKR
jgi:hypothetical protein